MKHNKRIIIIIGIVFSFILLSLSILKISLNILYPVNELSTSLKDSFKEVFGKAIKFDSLYFKYNGDIVLHNFYLSNTNDFNDNINLIKCQEITIDTSIIDLIRKKVTFSGVNMVEPEITIIKNYGKGYYETFINEIIGGVNDDNFKKYITGGFRLVITGANLSFRETFRNSKSEIIINDLDFKIKYRKEYITYKANGFIKNDSGYSFFNKSRFKLKGKKYFNKNHSETEIDLINFDLIHVNNNLSDNLPFKTSVSGHFTGHLELLSENENTTCSGNTSLSSFNFIYFDKDSPVTFLNNENISANFKFIFSDMLDKIKVTSLEIDNGTAEITSSMEFVENDFFSINIKSNRIDLDDLSETVYLFRDCRYKGEVSFTGSCRYSFKEKDPENLNFNFKLKKFNILPAGGSTENISNIKDGNLSITADKNRIDLKADFSSCNSDFNVSLNSIISKWDPFRSTNRIEINSKKIELEFLKDILINTIKKVYNLAYVDMFQNFDEQRNFLKEPEGIFINDNDITMKLHADRLVVAGKSSLNNLNFDISLIKGTMKTNSFSLDGYNGIYNFNLYSSLHQDYPYFKFNIEAKEVDLNRISDDSGLKYSFGGKLSLDMNFETNAYRIGQIVENGKAGFDLIIKDGYIYNTQIQKNLNDYFEKNSYKDLFNRRIEFSNFSISFMQSADSFYVKNFNLSSKELNFSSYGNYKDEDGLKLPIYLSINKEKNTDRASLEVTGNLETPCLRIKTKEKNDSLCF